MKKQKIHLICNSHIDPIWMWDWDEGASVALSTFYAAAQFADEFDYIFCHNEALLYEYVEKYDPVLFNKIKTLIKQGKWKVMGGWYLQPDCNLPSGESFVRQIEIGRQYFMEKFGVDAPTTAANFDSFGHSRGLVQVLRKTGHDSYIVCRPTPEFMEMKDYVVEWQGYDGSSVKLRRSDHMYTMSRGETVRDMKNWLEKNKDEKCVLLLWGAGNHGGAPSRKDLKDIAEWMQAEQDKEICHSTPERFFADVQPQEVLARSLQHWAPGCYSSMSRIKRKHVELETALLNTEKIAAVATLKCGKAYPAEKIKEATKRLLFMEFHDILPGTCILEGEKTALSRAEGALAQLKEIYVESFFALCDKFAKLKDGIYPMAVYNPNPYPVKTVVSSEFLIETAYESWETFRNIHVYDGDKELPSQVVEESSNINYDRRKRVLFEAELPAMETRLFGFEIKMEKMPVIPDVTEDVCVNAKDYSVRLDAKTGLLSSLTVDGKEYLAAPVQLFVYDDTPDPWGLAEEQLKGIGENPVAMELDTCDKGAFRGIKNVDITEEGALVTQVESLFAYGSSHVRLGYTFYKTQPYIDVNVDVYWNEREKTLKLHVPTLDGEFIGQEAFGTEILAKNGSECVAHRFIAVKQEDACLAVINNGTYGCSYKDGTAMITMLRGAAYCAHPLTNRSTLFKKNYIPYIEQGKHSFSFRICVAKENELEKKTAEFLNKLYALNIFPHGKGESTEAGLEIFNPNIVLVAFKQKEGDKDAYVIRLLNNCPDNAETEISCFGANAKLSFAKYEAKTLLFKNGMLIETDMVC